MLDEPWLVSCHDDSTGLTNRHDHRPGPTRARSFWRALCLENEPKELPVRCMRWDWPADWPTAWPEPMAMSHKAQNEESARCTIIFHDNEQFAPVHEVHATTVCAPRHMVGRRTSRHRPCSQWPSRAPPRARCPTMTPHNMPNRGTCADILIVTCGTWLASSQAYKSLLSNNTTTDFQERADRSVHVFLMCFDMFYSARMYRTVSRCFL